MSHMKKTRVIWIDIAKGLSILLIVFSHSPMEPLVSPFFLLDKII